MVLILVNMTTLQQSKGKTGKYCNTDNNVYYINLDTMITSMESTRSINSLSAWAD